MIFIFLSRTRAQTLVTAAPPTDEDDGMLSSSCLCICSSQGVYRHLNVMVLKLTLAFRLMHIGEL